VGVRFIPRKLGFYLVAAWVAITIDSEVLIKE